VRGGPDVLGLREGMEKSWQMMKATGPYLASPVFAIPLLWWLPRRLKRVGVLLVVAFVCDFAAVCLGGRYYEHYYLQVAISSCFLLGIAFQAVYERMRSIVVGTGNRAGGEEGSLELDRHGPAGADTGPRLRWLRGLVFSYMYWCAAAMVGLCVLLGAAGVKNYVKSYRLGLEERRRPGGPRTRAEAIGEAIRTVTEPHERMLLLGASPTSVYFLGHRLAGCRYYHLSPFFRRAFAEAMRKRHRDRFMADLERRRHVLIILAREERQIYFAGMEVVEKSAAAFLVPYLEENYTRLQELYRLSRIRKNLGWSWYGRYCSFLIRNDMAQEVVQRLEEAEAGGS